ncbi:DUF2158 domain-containing protein [Kosakonia sacchari]|uniref:YodC family protein n=1 Tax=Kosakonia sacchari TaxID=1158459 RepID=UPI0030BCA11C
MSVKFKDGTVVKLKSGGPDMTVNSYSSAYDLYLCRWFVSGEIKDEPFKEAELEEVSRKEVSLSVNQSLADY